jgi:dihydrodipicolinate synthase/N-acetylneuraminate lyase
MNTANNHRSFAREIRGPLVPILAAYKDDETLDIDSTCKWVDWMIGRGMTLFWTTYGTTHYHSLNDQEVIDLNKAVAATIGDRGIFIACAPWQWATRDCIGFVQQASDWGAHVVKILIDWALTPPDALVLEHYRNIARESPLPLMAYTLGLPAVQDDLLRGIIDIPEFIGMKNDSDNFYGMQRYLQVVREHGDPEEFLVMTGGGLSSMKLSFDLGVKAYGDTTPWYSPELSRAMYRALLENDRRLLSRYLVEVETKLMFKVWPKLGPVTFAHWSWAHAAACHMGLYQSPKMRFPNVTLTADQVAEVRNHLEELQRITSSILQDAG